MKKALLIATLFLTTICHAADWTTSGRLLLKDGTKRIGLGIYYVMYTAAGGNAAEQKRAAAIAKIGAAGFDFVVTPLSANNALTMSAAAAAGVTIIPEWNEALGYGAVDAAHGPFEIFQAYDDIEAGPYPPGANPPADCTIEIAAQKAALSGTPLAYSSGGLSRLTNWFGVGNDLLGVQYYPVESEPTTVVHTYSLPFMKSYNTGVFIANSQAWRWPAERNPTRAEVLRMAFDWMYGGAGGIIFYAYYDSGYDMDDVANLEVWEAAKEAVTAIRNSESFWIRRLEQWKF